MGGHGGLNILPQKKWNVYNFDNREKVKKDEEEAAKNEQIKGDESRKRDSHVRLSQLRSSRGLGPPFIPSLKAESSNPSDVKAVKVVSDEPQPEFKSKLNHINLFDGIRIFDPVVVKGDEEKGAFKKMKLEKKKKEEVRVVLPEDEKYRLGYGVAGKGVKLPWYMSKPIDDGKSGKNGSSSSSSDDGNGTDDVKHGDKSNGKKTLEKLREERLMREKKEKEREMALIMEKRKRDGAGYMDHRSFRR